ncbi:MAG: MFS transporter [Rhodobiaceae bacterium]|nr:MFS transporter [Rhodobiaceae bacterium]MCC0057000.1 MFS transporter [Rhodobiaceae bacterium]
MEDTGRPGTERIGIAAAIAMTTAVGVGLSLTIPLLAIAMELRGIPASMIGLNSAMAGIASISVAPMTPALLRRFGTAPLLLAAIVVSAISLMGFWLFQSLAAWFLLRVFFHSSITIIFIVSEYWIVAAAPDARRGLVMGIYATVLSAGFALGPLMLGLFGASGVWPFATGSLLLLAAAIPLIAAWRMAPVGAGDNQAGFLRMLLAVPVGTLAGFFFGFIEAGGFSLLPVFALKSGLSSEAAAGLIAAIAAGGALLLIPLGHVADRADRRRLLLITAAISALLIGSLPLLTQHYAALILVLVLYGGIAGSIYATGLTHIGARLKGGELAAANAGFVFMYSCGMLVGPATLGAAADLWSPSAIPLVLSFVLAFYALIVLWRIVSAKRAARP